MRKTLFFLLLLVGFASCDSGSKETVSIYPVVTYQETKTVSDVHYPNFGATTTYYTNYDGNRKCKNNSDISFRVTKTNKIINSADRCDNCGHTWYAHYTK